MKKLLVICEPRYDAENNCSINLAMHEILKEYSSHFDEVHCFCPGDDKVEAINGKDNIIYHVTDGYGGSRIQKLLYQLNPDTSFLKKVIDMYGINYIQIRIPSFFGLSFYKTIRNMPVVKTTYIAGDVSESIRFVFNKVPFIKTIAKLLEVQQYKIIKETLVVTTGPVLKEKYSFLNNNIHSFFSTTHNDIKRIERKTIHSSILRIIFLGRIDPAKRLEDLIMACALLKENNLDFVLNVIGDGAHLLEIKRLALELDVSDNIIFHGYIGNRDLIDEVLLESDVIVLPSLTEGTPKVLPEAMSRGVIPIAVKNVGSNNFIINHGESGFLVKARSPEDIFKSFKLLIESPTLTAEFMKQSYKYAEERTAQKEIDKIWDFVFNNSITNNL